MGSVTGSCFLHSPFCHSFSFPKSSSSRRRFHPPPISFSPLRNAHKPIMNIEATSFSEQVNPRNSDSRARRSAILLVGFAVIPLLNNIRANSIASLTAEDTQLRAQEQKEKAPSDATIESVNIKLKDKEALAELSLLYQQSEDQKISLKTEIKQLRDLFSKNEHELEFSNELVRKLNKELASSLAEKDELIKNLEDVLKELKLSLDEVKRNEFLISDLTHENNNLKELLLRNINEAKRNVEVLAGELMSTKELLNKSNKVFEAQFSKEKEARKNLEFDLENARDMVMRLGSERESLVERGKKLEEEVAYAKGEILRLRSQINVDQKRGKDAVTKRKVVRRRKVATINPKQEDS